MTQAQTIIRAAVAADIPAIGALVDANWRAVYGPLIGADAVERQIAERHAPHVLAEQLDGSHIAYLVAARNGRLVGHAYAFERNAEAYLDRLHVGIGMRGQGVGRALLAAIEVAANGRDIGLDVLSGNDAAVGFYQRLGYELVRTADSCGGIAGVPAHVMKKAAGSAIRPSPSV